MGSVALRQVCPGGRFAAHLGTARSRRLERADEAGGPGSRNALGPRPRGGLLVPWPGRAGVPGQPFPRRGRPPAGAPWLLSCRDTEEVKSKARQALTYWDAGQQSPDPPSSGSASFSTTHLKEEAEEPEEEAI